MGVRLWSIPGKERKGDQPSQFRRNLSLMISPSLLKDVCFNCFSLNSLYSPSFKVFDFTQLQKHIGIFKENILICCFIFFLSCFRKLLFILSSLFYRRKDIFNILLPYTTFLVGKNINIIVHVQKAGEKS